MRALVVEDEHRMASLLRRGLTEEGYAIDIAADGEEGLWLATAYRPTTPSWSTSCSRASTGSRRQNLHLIVDHGKVVSGLTHNRRQQWGNHRNQHRYTWRSALGTDAHGNHPQVVTCNLYRYDPARADRVQAMRLLARHDPSRYPLPPTRPAGLRRHRASLSTLQTCAPPTWSSSVAVPPARPRPSRWPRLDAGSSSSTRPGFPATSAAATG